MANFRQLNQNLQQVIQGAVAKKQQAAKQNQALQMMLQKAMIENAFKQQGQQQQFENVQRLLQGQGGAPSGARISGMSASGSPRIDFPSPKEQQETEFNERLKGAIGDGSFQKFGELRRDFPQKTRVIDPLQVRNAPFEGVGGIGKLFGGRFNPRLKGVDDQTRKVITAIGTDKTQLEAFVKNIDKFAAQGVDVNKVLEVLTK